MSDEAREEFKGEIAVGALVEITYAADLGNPGVTILTAGAGARPSKARTITPGTRDTIRLEDVEVGVLRIVVEQDDTASGRLEVKENGVLKDEEPPIVGQDSWAYSVA